MIINMSKDKVSNKPCVGDILVYQGANISSHYLIIRDSNSRFRAVKVEDNLLFRPAELSIDSLIDKLNEYHSTANYRLVKEDEYQLSITIKDS